MIRGQLAWLVFWSAVLLACAGVWTQDRRILYLALIAAAVAVILGLLSSNGPRFGG